MVEENYKLFPLHEACMASKFNMETFRWLIEAYPQASTEKDVYGRLPLHRACHVPYFRRHNQDFVSELLKIYPEATPIRDNKEFLPLHYMPQHFVLLDEKPFAIQRERTLLELIETYPDALLQSDGDNH